MACETLGVRERVLTIYEIRFASSLKMALSSYLVFKTARVAHVRAPGLALLRYVMMLVLMLYIGKAQRKHLGAGPSVIRAEPTQRRSFVPLPTARVATYTERLASHPNTSDTPSPVPLRRCFLLSSS